MKTKLTLLVDVLILSAFVLMPTIEADAEKIQQAEIRIDTDTIPAGTTTRVSVASDGSQGNYGSRNPSISADGRYVAFDSYSSNLVDGDDNGWSDVFLRDRTLGVTERVSIANDGSQGNFSSENSSLSANGRFIAFQSKASNLISGDTNDAWDVFVHDRETGKIERVSVASDGSQANGSSGNILYYGYLNNFGSSISADGRYVAFASEASNLVDGDTSGFIDVFVHDRQTGVTERVSVASDGSQACEHTTCPSSQPSLSADGRYVSFESLLSNLIDGDTNNLEDIFVFDRQTDSIERVSVSSSGIQGENSSNSPSISADGRYVAFHSQSGNLVIGDTNKTWDIFVHDRQSGVTERISIASDGSQGNSSSEYASISANSHYVSFRSWASNLVDGDTDVCYSDEFGFYNCYDIFVHDMQTGITERVSIASDGSQGNASSGVSSISRDGRYVAFSSEASNLVFGDSNESGDVFVRDRGAQEVDNSLYIPVTLNKP